MESMIKFLDENLKDADLETITKADLKKKYMKEKGLNSFTKEDKKLFSTAVSCALDKFAAILKAVDSKEPESELKEIYEKDSSFTKAESNGKSKGKRRLSSSSEDEDFHRTKRGKRKKQAKVSSDDESDAVEECNGCKELPGSLNSNTREEKVNAKGKKRKLSSETAERKTKKVHVISSDSDESLVKISKKKCSIDSEDESLGALALSESEEEQNQNLSKSSINFEGKSGNEKIENTGVKPSTQCDYEVSLLKRVEDPNSSGDELLSNLKKKDSSDSEDEPLINTRKKDSSDSEDEPLTNIKEKDSNDSEDEPLTNIKGKDSSDSEDEPLTNIKEKDSSDSEDEPMTNIRGKDYSESDDEHLKNIRKKDSSDSEDEPLTNIRDKDSSDSEEDPLSKFARKDLSKSKKNSPKLAKKDSSDSEDEPLIKLAKKDYSDSEDEPKIKVASKNESKRKSVILSDSEDKKQISRRSSVDTASRTKGQSLKKKKDIKRSDGESSDEGEKGSAESKSKEKNESKKKVNASEKKLESLKKYVRAAGIRVPSYIKLFECCKSMKAKHQKLIDLLEENGMKGRPTLAKCKKLKEKIETAREIAELDTTKIIPSKGRPKRNACADVSNRKDTTENVGTPLKVFSRLKGIVDSD